MNNDNDSRAHSNQSLPDHPPQDKVAQLTYIITESWPAVTDWFALVQKKKKKRWECKDCHKTKTPAAFNKHVQNSHKKCGVSGCGQFFASDVALEAHRRDGH